MPIINNTLSVSRNAYFAYNPAVEMLCSLHVLSDYSHHENCQAWAERAHKLLQPSLLEKITEYGAKYAQFGFIIDIADHLCDRSNYEENLDDINDFIQRLKTMSNNEFAYIFLGANLINHEKVDDWLKEPQSLDKKELGEAINYVHFSEMQSFLQNIDHIKSELIQMLTEYWDSFFHVEWQTLKPYYAKKLEEESTKFARVDTLEYILSLHSDLEFKDSRLIMKKKHEYSCNLDEMKEITLYISLFSSPHLLLNIYNSRLSIYVNTEMPKVEDTDVSQFVSFAKALGDVMRFNILLSLSKDSYTTKDLALKYKITPASISKHLKILKDANLIHHKKKKNFVHYCINNPQLLKCIRELSELFEKE